MTLESRQLVLLRPSAGGIQNDIVEGNFGAGRAGAQASLDATLYSQPNCAACGFPSRRLRCSASSAPLGPPSFPCMFNLASSSFNKPTSPGVLLMVGISIRELSAVAKIESGKWLNSAVRHMSLVLPFGCHIYDL